MRVTKAPLAGLFLYLCSLTLWGAPQRIVTLSPHAAELVCAAGGCDRIVGVVDYTDFPVQLKNRPHVGNYAAINIEAILSLKPDLIITWQRGNPSSALKQLRQFDIPMVDSSPTTLYEIPREIQRLGQMLDTRHQSELISQILTRQLDALKEQYGHRPTVSVFYEIWNRPLMSIGGGQFISEAISLCGGHNILASIDRPSLSVSVETVIARNPQVILIGGDSKTRASWKAAWLKWPQLSAVKQDQIHFVPPDLLQRPGPRLIAGTALICFLLEQARKNPAQRRVFIHGKRD